ncbi:hypothetical protein LCGC14_1304210, partial [marine sediment metagenome]
MSRMLQGFIRTAIILLILLLWLASSFSMESLHPNGSIRTYFINTKYPDGKDSAQGISMLRLKLSGNITGQTRFELAYEATPTWSDTSLGEEQDSMLQGRASYRVSDLDHLLYPANLQKEDRFMVTQNLD